MLPKFAVSWQGATEPAKPKKSAASKAILELIAISANGELSHRLISLKNEYKVSLPFRSPLILQPDSYIRLPLLSGHHEDLKSGHEAVHHFG